MPLFPQVFSRAPPNSSFWKCNKISMLFLPNMNNVIVYWYLMVCYATMLYIIFQYFLSVLAHNITNIPAESIAGKKHNLLTKQEPEGTYNIDLH